MAFQGYLLLSEAQLARTNYAAAEAVLEPLGKRALNPTNAWAWHYLGGRIRLGAGKVQEALDNTTNLMELAVKRVCPRCKRRRWHSELRCSKDWAEPTKRLLAFTNNLSGNIPAGRQRPGAAQNRATIARSKSNRRWGCLIGKIHKTNATARLVGPKSG